MISKSLLPFSFIKHWSGYRVGDCPSITQPTSQCVTSQAGTFCPFRHWQRFSVVANDSVVGSISCLLYRQCPTAIARLVVAICIWKTINGMSWGRSRPHVGNKHLERFQPSFANLNAATTIPFVAVCLIVVTSIFHTRPYTEFRRACFAVFETSGATSAAFYRLCSQMKSANFVQISTRTLTPPFVPVAFFCFLASTGIADNLEQPAFESGQVLKQTVCWDRNEFNHDGFLRQGTVVNRAITGYIPAMARFILTKPSILCNLSIKHAKRSQCR